MRDVCTAHLDRRLQSLMDVLNDQAEENWTLREAIRDKDAKLLRAQERIAALEQEAAAGVR